MAHSLPYEPAKDSVAIVEPFHTRFTVLLCTNSTVQSDVSFMLGCEHKNLLTFTFGCCAGEINVKHTHTQNCSMHVWNEELNSNGVGYVSVYKIRQIHLEAIRLVACVLKICGIMLKINTLFSLDITIGLFTLEISHILIYHSHCSIYLGLTIIHSGTFLHS